MTELTRCEHKVKLIVSTIIIFMDNFIINSSMMIVCDIFSNNSMIIDIMIHNNESKYKF